MPAGASDANGPRQRSQRHVKNEITPSVSPVTSHIHAAYPNAHPLLVFGLQKRLRYEAPFGDHSVVVNSVLLIFNPFGSSDIVATDPTVTRGIPQRTADRRRADRREVIKQG